MRLTISRKLLIGFGCLVGVIGARTIVFDQAITGIEADLFRLSDIVVPKTEAGYEMEINVLEMGLATTSYISTPDPALRLRLDEATEGFQRALADLQTLATTQAARQLATQIGALHHQFLALANSLLDAADRRPALLRQLTETMTSTAGAIDEVTANAAPGEEEQLVNSVAAAFDRVRVALAEYRQQPDALRGEHLHGAVEEYGQAVERLLALRPPPGGTFQLAGSAHRMMGAINAVADLEDALLADVALFVEVREDLDGALDEGLLATNAEDLTSAQASAEATAGTALTLGWLMLLFVLGATLVATLYIYRHIALPLRQVAQSAESLGRGETTEPVLVRSTDEIGNLAIAFNEMAARRRQAEAALLESQAELQTQNEQLRELDRMKGQFVATISHELRTPLTSIVGYLELLGDEGPGPLNDEQHTFLDVMRRSSGRLLTMIEDLLLIARIDAGKLVLKLGDVDVAEVLREAVDSARPNADGRGLDLQMRAEPRLVVRGDRLRLGQVADNLLSNAVKFTPPGGRVIVSAHADADRAVIEVRDTGIGIPEAEQARLFERFFRSSTAFSAAIPGTGIGLNLAKAVVEAHGGTITCSSRFGEGTSFTITLPANGTSSALVAAGERRVD